MLKRTFKHYLTETPLPDTWDKSIYTDNQAFYKRVDYAKERAKSIGSGSSRVAFVIPYEGRDTVLKIAKNQKGMVQNEEEVSILNDWYLKKLNLFIPIIDYDEKSSAPTWIHVEKANKATNIQFVTETGLQLVDLINYVYYYHKGVNHLSDHYEKLFNSLQQKINEESELVQSLIDYFGNYDVYNDSTKIADYKRIANWGVYNNNLVIIDAGINSDIFSTMYLKN